MFQLLQRYGEKCVTWQLWCFAGLLAIVFGFVMWVAWHENR